MHKTIFVELTPDTRKRIEDAIEQMMLLLDTIDGDENLEEPGDLEPALGWTDRGPAALAKHIPDDDREVDDENDEDGADTEPEETDYDLAGADTDLEHCDGDYDAPLFIWGGGEGGAPTP